MKLFILSVSLFFFNICISQNNDKAIYQSAIDTIKKTTEFIEYVNINSPKYSNFKVAENLYPICAYCGWFKDEVKCCAKSTLEDLFGQKKVADLEMLGTKNGKYTVYFTNIENSHFIVEVMHSKKHKESLLYLFKINNETVSLIKTDKNITK